MSDKIHPITGRSEDEMARENLMMWLEDEESPLPHDIRLAIIARLQEAEELKVEVVNLRRWLEGAECRERKEVKALESENKRLRERWKKLRKWIGSRDAGVGSALVHAAMDSLESDPQVEKEKP